MLHIISSVLVPIPDVFSTLGVRVGNPTTSSTIAFVADSADSRTFADSANAFAHILGWVHHKTPFLFLATKIDIKEAKKIDEVEKEFDLKQRMHDKKFFNCFEVSAAFGDHVEEAFAWLSAQLLEMNHVIDFKMKQPSC